MSNSILKFILGLTIFFFVLVLFTACEKQAQSSAIKGNNIEVEFLFEQDSVKVYRFYDGSYHYFTTRGETMSTKSAGKISYQENIK
jgi:hypothetical protein